MGAPGTLVFAVTGMHCASCGLLIDDAVEDVDGVQRCQTDARRGRTVVTVASAAATADAIMAAIVEAGYQAEVVAD
jgi:copper chaperone